MSNVGPTAKARSARPWFVVLPLVLSSCSGDGAPRSDDLGPYAPVVEALETFITAEMEQKDLPGLSIALVDDQRTIWAAGFGFQDPGLDVAATAETVYRVGSVSKLFTDIAIMQRVERGEVDLDAPITTYLPDFAPMNPFGGDITLRQLMSHRSGLVREPPIGHYFDPTEPTLKATVESLNETSLVYAPESRHKYSNAAIAVVGYVLEVLSAQEFAPALAQAVLQPLGMERTAFEPTPAVVTNLAKAVMWSYDGREFPAPTFELGMAPAGSMYSTVTDLALFMSALFDGGQGVNGPVLSTESLEAMWTPQFDEPGAVTGRGIGFGIGTLDGQRRIGHGGAIYGFSTELSALPDARLGVVVSTTRDFSNGVTRRIASEALRMMAAAKAGDPLTLPQSTSPLAPGQAAALEGRYRDGAHGADVIARGDRLFVTETGQGYTVEARARGQQIVVDDRMSFGRTLDFQGGSMGNGPARVPRVAWAKPSLPPTPLEGLIGEYGWDHNVLFIFERDGQLWALIEWLEMNPLEEVSPDVYRFPAGGGLYHGEHIVFERDESGQATVAVAAGIPFLRRNTGPEEGSVFRIDPIRPVNELRREALAAEPPVETGEFVDSHLVELVSLDPSIELDIRYAGTDNFMSTPFYERPQAFMQREAAEAVVRVHQLLNEAGYGLLIHDAYRPWYVTKMFWDATPDSLRIFVADPASGSRHNRGAAVDLTLFDRATGQPVEMTGGYDEFSERSFPDYPGGTSNQRWHRELLRRAMESEDFDVYEFEWWHFDFRGWERFRIRNDTFDAL